MGGVEFLSLPPLCYYRGSAQPDIRAVLGGLRQVSRHDKSIIIAQTALAQCLTQGGLVVAMRSSQKS